MQISAVCLMCHRIGRAGSCARVVTGIWGRGPYPTNNQEVNASDLRRPLLTAHCNACWDSNSLLTPKLLGAVVGLIW